MITPLTFVWAALAVCAVEINVPVGSGSDDGGLKVVPLGYLATFETLTLSIQPLVYLLAVEEW